MIIDGREIAREIIARLKEKPRPGRFLGAVLTGEDSASASFLQEKARVAHELGIDFRVSRFPENVRQDTLQTGIEHVASNPACGGIIVQLPLPAHLDRDLVIAIVPEEKDVDALRGSHRVLAPAAGAVSEILKAIKSYSLRTVRAAVVGANGFLVGRPVAAWLTSQGASVEKLDIGSDLSSLHYADIVVLGTGRPGIVTPEALKEGACVIDFGYGRRDGKAHGDFNPAPFTVTDSKQKVIFYTPTPGGTGPILVAKLFENFYTLNATQ